MSIDQSTFISVSEADAQAARGGKPLPLVAFASGAPLITGPGPATRAAIEGGSSPQPGAVPAAPTVRPEVLAERARCRAILTHANAAGRESFALHLVCETDFSAEAAIAMLGAAPAPAAAPPAAAGHQPRLIPEPRWQASHAPPGAHGAALSPQEVAARVNASRDLGGSLPAGRGGALSTNDVARRLSP
jgi:hypothetical protein